MAVIIKNFAFWSKPLRCLKANKITFFFPNFVKICFREFFIPIKIFLWLHLTREFRPPDWWQSYVWQVTAFGRSFLPLPYPSNPTINDYSFPPFCPVRPALHWPHRNALPCPFFPALSLPTPALPCPCPALPWLHPPLPSPPLLRSTHTKPYNSFLLS